MPGKSRQAKAKRYYAKKNRTGARPGTIEQPQTIAAAAAQPVTATRASVSPRTTSPRGMPTATTHQYIGAELRKIFILAAIMLVIIIVLARFLS